jgi:hypothetical protein
LGSSGQELNADSTEQRKERKKAAKSREWIGAVEAVAGRPARADGAGCLLAGVWYNLLKLNEATIPRAVAMVAADAVPDAQLSAIRSIA